MKFCTKKLFTVPPVLKQIIATVCCGIVIFGFSISMGWMTINSVELQNKNSTYGTGPLSLHDVSLVISIFNVGCLIGTFTIVPAVQMMGPKRAIQLCNIPLILSALLIIFAQNVYYLYASRILTGLICGGMPFAMSTIINNTCFDHVRGTLMALYDAFLSFGGIASFFFGNILNYTNQAIVCLIVPCFFIIVQHFIPESPEFLTKCGKENQARKSRKFYKGSHDEYKANNEIATANNHEKVESVIKNVPDGDVASNSRLTFSDFTTPEAKKACFISLISYPLSILAGNYAVNVYVTDIFARTGSPLSEKSSSLVIAVITLVGNLSFLTIVDKFSRKVLYVSSSIATALSYLVFGIYSLLWLHQPEFEWIPLVCFSCLAFFCTMGLLPIPFVMTMEIFPKKIRSVCVSINVCSMFVILYILMLIIPIFLDEISLFWLCLLFGGICTLNAVFGFFYMPDTRGKSYEEILELLAK